jgi:hypothetical protein
MTFDLQRRKGFIAVLISEGARRGIEKSCYSCSLLFVKTSLTPQALEIGVAQAQNHGKSHLLYPNLF